MIIIIMIMIIICLSKTSGRQKCNREPPPSKWGRGGEAHRIRVSSIPVWLPNPSTLPYNQNSGHSCLPSAGVSWRQPLKAECEKTLLFFSPLSPLWGLVFLGLGACGLPGTRTFPECCRACPSAMGASLVTREGRRFRPGRSGSSTGRREATAAAAHHPRAPPAGALSATAVPAVAAAPPVPARAGPRAHHTNKQDQVQRTCWCWSWKPCIQVASPVLFPCMRSRSGTGTWDCAAQVLPGQAHRCTREHHRQGESAAHCEQDTWMHRLQRMLEPDSCWKKAKPPTFLKEWCLGVGKEVPGTTLN